jgi:hypothetical protein
MMKGLHNTQRTKTIIDHLGNIAIVPYIPSVFNLNLLQKLISKLKDLRNVSKIDCFFSSE